MEKQDFDNYDKSLAEEFASKMFQFLNGGMLSLMISKGYLAIPQQHDKVITSLRTAWAKELSLDKEVTSYDDSLDGLRLALKGYQIE